MTLNNLERQFIGLSSMLPICYNYAVFAVK